MSSNDGFVDMPEISRDGGGGPTTPHSSHGGGGPGSSYLGGDQSPQHTPYHTPNNESTPSIHHFPHFTPDGIPVYSNIGPLEIEIFSFKMHKAITRF